MNILHCCGRSVLDQVSLNDVTFMPIVRIDTRLAQECAVLYLRIVYRVRVIVKKTIIMHHAQSPIQKGSLQKVEAGEGGKMFLCSLW